MVFRQVLKGKHYQLYRYPLPIQEPSPSKEDLRGRPSRGVSRYPEFLLAIGREPFSPYAPTPGPPAYPWGTRWLFLRWGVYVSGNLSTLDTIGIALGMLVSTRK